MPRKRKRAAKKILSDHLAWTRDHTKGRRLVWSELTETERANLSWANLSGADLTWAKHKATRWPSAQVLLLAAWRQTALCADLMRYDAANHPAGEAPFDAWAKGGPCPYENCAFGRAANFSEDRKKWKPGPAKSALELAKALIAEKLEEVK